MQFSILRIIHFLSEIVADVIMQICFKRKAPFSFIAIFAFTDKMHDHNLTIGK